MGNINLSIKIVNKYLKTNILFIKRPHSRKLNVLLQNRNLQCMLSSLRQRNPTFYAETMQRWFERTSWSQFLKAFFIHIMFHVSYDELCFVWKQKLKLPVIFLFVVNQFKNSTKKKKIVPQLYFICRISFMM